MRRALLIFRCILCALIAVSALEIAARIDDSLNYGAPFWGPYNDQALYVTDQAGKWGKPAARYERWQLNSLGYRGPELRSGTVRIVCFGSSETFGLYETPGYEYPRQLEQDLNKLAGEPMFQVVNAAYPGETIRTAIRHVPQVVQQTHPSYALIYPAIANYIPPVNGTGGPASSGRFDKLGTILSEMRVAERIRNVLKSSLPERIQTGLRKREIDRDSAGAPVMDRLPEKYVEQFRGDLTILVHSLRDRDVEPILATHATVFGATLSPSDRDLLTAWRKFYPMLKEDGFVDMEERMNQVIRETASRENIRLIDIANDIPHRPEYFADFVHFTTDGAALMAQDLTAGLTPWIFSRRPEDSAITSTNQPRR